MGRYIKNHSNYIRRKKHQDTVDGRILEKDWVTIGGVERYYSRDKMKSYHGDGNFVFTITNIPTYQKKHRLGDFVASWTYGDVKNAPSVTNTVKRNNRSGDLCDFAYYGSASELIRASVLDIVSNFPPYLTVRHTDVIKNGHVASEGMRLSSSEEFEENIKYYGDENPLPYDGGIAMGRTTPDFNNCYIVDNPCGMNLYERDPQIDEFDDENHYLWTAWENFVYTTDGKTYSSITERPTIENVAIYPHCSSIELVWHITIDDVNLWGVSYFGEMIFVCDKVDFMMMPKAELIDGYFDNVDSFESILLNRTSSPYYTNSLVTPKRTDFGTVSSVNTYTWPSIAYTYRYTSADGEEIDCEFHAIDTQSPKYKEYIISLGNLGDTLDELYADNIWSKMIHEAVKNYDWSYTRYYNDQMEEEHILGGKRVENLIRVIGRGFDEVKRDAEGLKMTSNITYDGQNNICDAELSDKLELMGWEITSTVPTDNE